MVCLLFWLLMEVNTFYTRFFTPWAELCCVGVLGRGWGRVVGGDWLRVQLGFF